MKLTINKNNEKEQYQKESLYEETLNNFDSVYFEFSDNQNNENEISNKEKEKIKKIMKFDEEIRKIKIYSSDKINYKRKKMINENEKEIIETKRENSIIYPINEIEHLVFEDIYNNLDRDLKQKFEKEKKIIDYCDLTKNKESQNKINNIINYYIIIYIYFF